jgi:hypothetical protein
MLTLGGKRLQFCTEISHLNLHMSCCHHFPALQVEELESELSSLRSSRGMPFNLPSAEAIMSSLGLQQGTTGAGMRDRSSSGSLLPSSGSALDLEALRRVPLKKKGTSGTGSKGTLPLRTWLLIAYGTVLHVALMASVSSQTHAHNACLHPGALPGQ